MAPPPSREDPTREEVEARLEALSARVPSRRSTDRTVHPPRLRHEEEIQAAETIARLAALSRRLDTMRGRQ